MPVPVKFFSNPIVARRGLQSNETLKIQFSGLGTDAFEIKDDDVDFGLRVYSAKGATNAVFFLDGVGIAQLTDSAFTVIGTALFDNGSFGTLAVSSRVQLTQAVSPATLTTSQNNWAPGNPVPTNIRVSANSGLSITGIANGVQGQRITLHNVGSNAITLAHLSLSSTAGNRFICPNSSAFTLRINAAVDMWYDLSSNAWRLISP